jgi:hypothetical protein
MLLIRNPSGQSVESFRKLTFMPKTDMNSPLVAHPMTKLQRQVRSLVDKKLLKPTDSIWKIALLYGDEWAYWKQELLAYDFAMKDPVSYLLAVESWDDED